MKKIFLPLVISLSVMFSGCSSGPDYKKQAYGQMKTSKTFEFEFPIVWKGILSAFESYKLQEKNSEKGNVITDWVYTTSNEKYVEYAVNGFPRKKFLQTRYKYIVSARKQIGGVDVNVDLKEEIENLKLDGTSDGWITVDDLDSHRQNEVLNLIEQKILSLPNI